MFHCKMQLPNGLYTKDISKVQKGASAYVFQCHRAYLLRHSNSHEPVVGPASECCFSIIGSECCLSFEVPSQVLMMILFDAA